MNTFEKVLDECYLPVLVIETVSMQICRAIMAKFIGDNEQTCFLKEDILSQCLFALEFLKVRPNKQRD